MIDLKLIACAILGHRTVWANGGRDGIAGAADCARCGHHQPAVVWDRVPPMPECEPPKAERAEVLSIAAGDTLIVTCDRVLTPLQVEQIKAGALDNLPAGCKVIVLHGGLSVAGMAKASPIDTSIARLDVHNPE